MKKNSIFAVANCEKLTFKRKIDYEKLERLEDRAEFVDSICW
jgi:hypothetical protein